MGLDMYLRGEKFFWTDWNNPENNRSEDSKKVSTLTVELGYWRKHANLHGAIVKHFAGGVDECQRIHLDAEKLKTLIEMCRDGALPHTTGFFFGSSDCTQEERDEDVKILTEAVAWLETPEKGVVRDVYYQASW